MRLKGIEVVLRKDGHFYYNGKLIKAVYPGEGYAVMMVFRPSQIDRDFDEYVFVITQDEYEEIGRKLKESDEKTHKLLGRGWGGKRPCWYLHDFI